MVKFVQGDLVATYDLIIEMKLISFNWSLFQKGESYFSDDNYRFQYILFHILDIEESTKPIIRRMISRSWLQRDYNPNDIMYWEVTKQDILNHSKGLLSTEDYLVGWPTGFEIKPDTKSIVVNISNISVGEIMSRFLPEGIPDIDKQRKIIVSSEGY